MRARIAGLIEVDHAATNVTFQFALQRSAPVWNWCEVTRSDV